MINDIISAKILLWAYSYILKDGTQIRTGDGRFAIFCLTTWLHRQFRFIKNYNDFLAKLNFCQF